MTSSLPSVPSPATRSPSVASHAPGQAGGPAGQPSASGASEAAAHASLTMDQVWDTLQHALSRTTTAEAPAAVRWISEHLPLVERAFLQRLDADPVSGARVGLGLAHALDWLGADDALRRTVLGIERVRGRLPPALADEVLVMVARDGVRRREGIDWLHELGSVRDRAAQRRDDRLLGQALRVLAQSAWQEGKATVAIDTARQACALPEGEAAFLLLGNYLWGIGEHAAAEAAYVDALQRPETRANPMRAAALAANLASLMAEQARHAEAIKGFRFALRIQTAAGALRHELILRSNLGMALVDAGELAEAEEQLEQASALGRRALGGASSAAPREGLVCLRLLQNDPAGALSILNDGQLVDDADPWYDGQLRIWGAFARAALGRRADAIAAAQAGAQRARAVNDRQAGPLLAELALIYIDRLDGLPLDLGRLAPAEAAAARWQCLRIGLRLVYAAAAG